MRAYRDGDEEGILELWKAVIPERQYNREQWMRWWHWQYKENPAGMGKIWLAEHNDKIVGQYAIIPVVMTIAGKTILGAQSVDTMTHPDYRRQKIFEILAKKVYDEAEKDGIFIVYGFPGELSYPGFISKLAWFDVGTMQAMFKPLNWANALNLKISNKFLLRLGTISGNILQKVAYRAKNPPVVEGLTIAQISYFDECINDFWVKVSSEYEIKVVRNKDYLDWRYFAIPDIDYSIYIAEKAGGIYGYLVLRCIQREGANSGVIFDILTQSEQVAQCLVSKALEHCRREKVDLVSYWMIAGKTYFNALRKNGFISIPVIKGGPFCAYSSSPHISRAFLADSKNWLVQIGDSDTI